MVAKHAVLRALAFDAPRPGPAGPQVGLAWCIGAVRLGFGPGAGSGQQRQQFAPQQAHRVPAPRVVMACWGTFTSLRVS